MWIWRKGVASDNAWLRAECDQFITAFEVLCDRVKTNKYYVKAHDFRHIPEDHRLFGSSSGTSTGL
jgi:hypothetical protein